MKKALSIYTFLLVILLTTAGVTLGQDSNEPDVVKVVYAPFHSYAFIDIGIEEGYFADQNIEIEKVFLSNGSDGALLLLQGEIDVLPTQTTSGIINAMLRADDLKIVGNMTYLNPDRCNHMSFFVADKGDETITEISEVAGTTVVISNGVTEYILEKVLNAGGLTIDDVTVTNMPPPARMDAAIDGAASMVHMAEPWLTRALANENLVEFAPNIEYAPDIQLAVFMYGPNMINNPDLANRFMVAAIQSTRQFNEAATERNVEIVAKAQEYEPEFLESICWQYLSQNGPDDLVPLQPYVDWLYQREQIDEPLQIVDYYDTTYYDYAIEQLGSYEESESSDTD